jgi:RNA polymerase sigma-70 factor, ECF subfamily
MNWQEQLAHLQKRVGVYPLSVEDRKDVVSMTILALLEKEHLYTEEGKRKKWLNTFLHNQYRKFISRSSRLRKYMEKKSHLIKGDEVCEHSFNSSTFSRPVQRALDSIPDNTRHAMIKVYIEGWTTQELAKEEQTSKGTITSRLSRGSAQMRELLSEVEIG